MPVRRCVALALLIVLCGCQPTPGTLPTPTSPPPTSPAAKPTSAPTSAPAQPTVGPTAAPPPTGSTRVELLNAANAASKPEDAAVLYERVLNTPPPAGEPKAASDAINDYADFRAMVSLVSAGNEDDARAHVEALRARGASAPLGRLADQFWNQYSMTASARAACAQLQPEIASQAAPVLSTLQGLGVRADAASLCRVN